MSRSSIEQERLNTNLFQAVSAGKVKEINSLIKSGANIDAKNEQGLTPLHLAVIKALEGTMQAVRTGRGSAVKKPYGDVAVALIMAGADIKEKDEFERTPLHSPVVQNNTELVDILFDAAVKKAGADPISDDVRRKLHSAVEPRVVQAGIVEFDAVNLIHGLLAESTKVAALPSKARSTSSETASIVDESPHASVGEVAKEESAPPRGKTLRETFVSLIPSIIKPQNIYAKKEEAGLSKNEKTGLFR